MGCKDSKICTKMAIDAFTKCQEGWIKDFSNSTHPKDAGLERV